MSQSCDVTYADATSVVCPAQFPSHRLYKPSRWSTHVSKVGPTSRFVLPVPRRTNSYHYYPSKKPFIMRSIYYPLRQSLVQWLPYRFCKEVHLRYIRWGWSMLIPCSMGWIHVPHSASYCARPFHHYGKWILYPLRIHISATRFLSLQYTLLSR